MSNTQTGARTAPTAVASPSPVPGAGVPRTGGIPIVEMDPARRADVLFRVRRDEGHEVSAWWMIAAFLATSGVVIALLSGVPGGA